MTRRHAFFVNMGQAQDRAEILSWNFELLALLLILKHQKSNNV